MVPITPGLLAKAIRAQESMSTEDWVAHGNVLFAKQRVMFLELLTFGRDGVEEPQLRGMLDFLAVLQRVAESVCDEIAAPVEMPEFSAAVERAVLWFKSLDTGSLSKTNSMIDVWFAEMRQNGEPLIWAFLMDLLDEKRILAAPLASGMIVTLYAIADVFNARCARRGAR